MRRQAFRSFWSKCRPRTWNRLGRWPALRAQLEGRRHRHGSAAALAQEGEPGTQGLEAAAVDVERLFRRAALGLGPERDHLLAARQLRPRQVLGRQADLHDLADARPCLGRDLQRSLADQASRQQRAHGQEQQAEVGGQALQPSAGGHGPVRPGRGTQRPLGAAVGGNERRIRAVGQPAGPGAVGKPELGRLHGFGGGGALIGQEQHFRLASGLGRARVGTPPPRHVPPSPVPGVHRMPPLGWRMGKGHAGAAPCGCACMPPP